VRTLAVPVRLPANPRIAAHDSARLYTIVATDYPGLGTPGPHPYLVGISEARAVLDSVRVAQLLSDGGHRFAVWGHSQGGHAALYTGLLSQTYAPDLKLVGVAAAAPATELARLMNDDFGSSGGKNLTAMTLWSWSRVFGAPLNRVVVPEAIPVIDRLAAECIESILDIWARQRTERPLERKFLAVEDLAETEPWRSLLARNTPGTLPSAIPVFLAQGTADTLVRPEVTRSYMTSLCRAGSAVRMVLLPKIGHAFIARDIAGDAIDWITDRFAGAPPATNCEN
jgi:pimeloyl-ACP methyl ester carboxylesterase